MTHNQLHRRLRGFTVIELLVVIGILTAIFTLTALASPALSVAGRLQRLAMLSELGAGLSQAIEEVQDIADEARAAVILFLTGHRIDREHLASLVARLEAAGNRLAVLVSRMEDLKPQLADERDRHLLCDAIEATRDLAAAIQRLSVALQVLELIKAGQE
jgi:hypothetical protein